jgi:hypothetical protein
MDELHDSEDTRLLRRVSSNSLDTFSDDDLMSANIRDIADLVPEVLRSGRLYRSSQFHTPEVREALGIVAVMDLRRASKLCTQPNRVSQEFLWPDWMLLHAQDTFGDPLVPRCPNCEGTLKLQPRASGQDTENADIEVCPAILSKQTQGIHHFLADVLIFSPRRPFLFSDRPVRTSSGSEPCWTKGSRQLCFFQFGAFLCVAICLHSNSVCIRCSLLPA